MIRSPSLVPHGMRLESEPWSSLLVNGFQLGAIVLSPNLGIRITIPSHHHPLNEKVILRTK